MTLRPAPSMEGRVGSCCNNQIALRDYIFKTLPGCITLNLMNGLALVVHLGRRQRQGWRFGWCWDGARARFKYARMREKRCNTVECFGKVKSALKNDSTYLIYLNNRDIAQTHGLQIANIHLHDFVERPPTVTLLFGWVRVLK